MVVERETDSIPYPTEILGFGLLEDWQKEAVAKTVRNIRHQPISNHQAQELNERWIVDAFLLTPEVKDEIGRLWLRKILQVDDKIVEWFVNNPHRRIPYRKYDASYAVGMRHGGVISYRADGAGFWQEVGKLCPDRYSETDIGFLSREDKDGVGAWSMINTFEFGHPNSQLLSRLVTNAVAYK